MIRKSFLGLIVLIFAFVLFACQEDIEISIDTLSVTLTEGDTYQIAFESNDETLDFKSSDTQVVTVNDSGLVEAKQEGEAIITVTSTKDETIFIDIEIIVEKALTLSVEANAYQIKVGETETLAFIANDDVTFVSSDTNVLTVDDEGNIFGVTDGQATVTITSAIDQTLSEEIVVTVRKVITLEVEKTSYQMWVGKTETVSYISNEDVYFEVKNETIANISEAGVITGLQNGMTEIEIISSYDQSVKEVITVRVYNDAETIIITGQQTLNVNTTTALNAEVGPDDAYAFVRWTSSDESVATISSDGIVTALSSGVATITAVSDFDESLTATFELEVVNYLLVDETKVISDKVEYSNMTFEYGVDLFSNIQDAIDAAQVGSTIFISTGSYKGDLEIHVDNLTIHGLSDVVIEAQVDIISNHVSIMNVEFTGQSGISNTQTIENFVFNGNSIKDITGTSMFIHFHGIYGLEVKENVFTNLSGDAIVIENYLGGIINIYKNNISNVDTAIKMIADQDYDSETKLQIERNIISFVNIGVDITTLFEIDVEDYVRFNQVSNFNILAAKANENHQVDFTLNYWGSETLDQNDFENISLHALRGFYTNESSIISESKYNPLVPVKVLPAENELLMNVGDTHTFEFEVLPLGSNPDRIRFITSNTDKVQFESYGVMKGLESGFAEITLRLSTDFSVNAVVSIELTTDPGIELTPSITTQSLIVGDTLTLDALVFPYQIKDENVLFESLNPAVASINQNGEISSYSEGMVTFIASLESDSDVKTEFILQFYNTLDENDLMDVMTTGQISYTTPHKWIVYGVTHDYLDFKYESVSRYYFDEIVVNTSKMIPLGNNRPGIKKSNPVQGMPIYNSDNVYYVVVHETANTSPGQGALAHANYLYNGAINGNVSTSWHYTMDDKEVYQHVPLDEIAYHAGDGSRVAGTFWGTDNQYIGGGNRNGIGIETSVAQDGDNYRVWQRTAKLSAELLVEYNLPVDHMKYHNHFSGKMCPQSMLRGGLTPLFEEMVAFEYKIQSVFADATIEMVSNNPEYVDHTGRVINMPDRPTTVSYTITVNLDGIESSRTFYSYLPGTIR